MLPKPEHFNALQQFWNYIQNNPQQYNSEKSTTAYILPPDYGFGFRRPDDTIWGILRNDTLSAKVWNDTNNLTNTFGTKLDIVYDDPEFNNALTQNYNQLYFWNQTIT